MAALARIGAFGAATLLLAVATAGCITVFPGRSAVTTDPRTSTLDYLPVIAFEHQEDPEPTGCPAGTDSRTIFVPQLARAVTVDVHAKITSVGEPLASQDFRHFDFTVADGEGTLWVDIHLRNNGTDKQLTIEGPRPGGWTVTLSWNICNIPAPGSPIKDEFRVLVVVQQPA